MNLWIFFKWKNYKEVEEINNDINLIDVEKNILKSVLNIQ